jgi:hypothetical protein
MRTSLRLLVLAAALGVLVFAGSSSAWAYWRSSGHGTGTATAGTLRVQVLSPDGSQPNATLLLPGGSADAAVRVHNPNALPITVISVEPAGDPVASNGCTPTGVAFTARHGLDLPVPAGATAVLMLPGSVTMSPASAAACQGASFSIPVSVTVRS